MAAVCSPTLAPATPPTRAAAAATASAAAGVVITATGPAAPAGKDLASVLRPATDSALVRNVSV